LLRIPALLFAALLAGCASGPAPVAPDRASAWGYVRLVPRDGVAAIAAGAKAYADREVADAQLLDYSTPGFAVVWADGAPPPGSATRVSIRSGVGGAEFDPPHAALGAGGTIRVANESGDPHVLSCPAASRVERLAPGETVEIPAAAAGEWPLFLLDAPTATARIFAAPGPFAIASNAGRFSLADLAPGATRLGAWHPRFPSAAVAVDLRAGQSTRVDLELRVGDAAPGATDAP
jgi:hypothetical protein